jgi:hypothetical protein
LDGIVDDRVGIAVTPPMGLSRIAQTIRYIGKKNHV